MKQPEECKNMQEIRMEIDKIDHKIVELISKRAQYVNSAAKFKKNEVAVRDKERAAAVIESKKELAKKLNTSPELIANIYETMIGFFINEEMEHWKSKKKSTNKSDESKTFIQKINEILIKNNADFEIIRHDKPIRTKSDAERYFKIEETAPTLILKTEIGYFALITSGKREKVDMKSIKKLLNCKDLALADKTQIKEKFGMEPGQVPLVGHKLPTIVDNLIHKFDYVYGGCGDALQTLKIKPSDLLKANNVVLNFD